MRALLATTATQGTRPTDYCWAHEGELVRLPGLTCDCPDCGCDRGFAGLTSSRATTTCMVSEIDLDATQLREIVTTTLRREGWIGTCGDDEDENASMIDAFVETHIETAEHFPVGTVLELRDGSVVSPRAWTSPVDDAVSP